MGGIAVATGILGMASSYSKGRAEKRAYESEAKQAELQAEMDTIGRKRELEDALSMQAVMFASQGRQAGVGSAQAIQEEDIKRAGQDIDMIKAGAKVKSTSSKVAGRYAQQSAITSGLISGGQSLMNFSRAGGKEWLMKDDWKGGK
jgi:hypothetical protein